jgi:hypothetical protein
VSTLYRSLRVFLGPAKMADVLPNRSNLVELFGAVNMRLHMSMSLSHVSFYGMDPTSRRLAATLPMLGPDGWAWAPLLPADDAAFGLLVDADGTELYLEGVVRRTDPEVEATDLYAVARVRTPPKASPVKAVTFRIFVGPPSFAAVDDSRSNLVELFGCASFSLRTNSIDHTNIATCYGEPGVSLRDAWAPHTPPRRLFGFLIATTNGDIYVEGARVPASVDVDGMDCVYSFAGIVPAVKKEAACASS